MVLIVSALAIERVAGVTLLPSGLTAGLRPPPKKFPVLPASPPVSIAAKRIDLNAQIHPVGLAADGSIGVPGEDQAHEAAWYEQSPTPGQYGPSVIVGHVDNRSGPAVFHGLKELRAGDEVDVSRADGSTAVFAVDAVKRYDKERIPPDEVYGDFSRPNLRLITCGGRWVGGQTGYSDNVVVFATLVRSRVSAAAQTGSGSRGSSQYDQRGSAGRWPSTRQAAPLGAAGGTASRQPSSAVVLSPLLWLQRAQAATTFSQLCRPPRLRGMTWSMVSAGPWQ